MSWPYRKYRDPVNLNLELPVGHLNIKGYQGVFAPSAIFVAFFVTVVPLFLWLLTLALGAVFSVFGADGPSWIETIALIFVASTLGMAVRK